MNKHEASRDCPDGAACQFARDNFGASFDLAAECGTTCDNCGSPITDRGAHGLGCERCAESEESTMNGET
jgi:hypothetical protein